MDPLPPLDELERKISGARKTENDAVKRGEDSGFGLALRIGAEFASGVLAGGGFGWLLDKWLGTSPALFILCFLLGSAAGGLTVYRTVARLDERQEEENNRKG